jgi:hypothetical protein
MSMLPSDLHFYGSAVMADDDSVLAIGGVIDLTRGFTFADMNVDGGVQVVSSNAGDTTQSVTVYYKNSAGAILNEIKALVGQTPQTLAATMRTLMKAIKSATCAGDVAVEAQTAERSNTAQGAGGGTDTIQLDAGASAVDRFYVGMVIRTTGGAGPNQVRKIIDYRGSDKLAVVNRPWDVAVTATTTFRIARGMVFEKSPSEILEVRRAHYDVAADDLLGITRKYYEKVFLKNTHGSLSLLSAQVIELSDPTAKMAFGVAASLDDSGTNGGSNNRLVAPSAITFDSATKNVIGGTLAAGQAQGVWLEFTRSPGDAALKSTYLPKGSGVSSA